MAGKNPYLRRRSNSSLEYFRPIPARLHPFFSDYLNGRRAIYHIFRTPKGRPEKDPRNVEPAYFAFHAAIQQRKVDAEAGRIVTPDRVIQLNNLAGWWLD